MRQLVFALQFKGSAAPVEGAEGKLRARTTARGQTHRTAIGAGGVLGSVASTGGAATFESEVQMVGEGTFLESGTIRYGPAAQVSFKTVGQGVLGPSGVEGLQRGAVIWEVTGAGGRLSGATGLITSNFTVGANGEVVDNHFAQFFVPGDAPGSARAKTAKRRGAAKPSRGKARRR
jgi:hypothetical protein